MPTASCRCRDALGVAGEELRLGELGEEGSAVAVFGEVRGASSNHLTAALGSSIRRDSRPAALA